MLSANVALANRRIYDFTEFPSSTAEFSHSTDESRANGEFISDGKALASEETKM